MTGGKTSYENMHKYKHMEELYCEKYKILFFLPQQNIWRSASWPSYSFPHFYRFKLFAVHSDFTDFYWFSALLVTSHFLYAPSFHQCSFTSRPPPTSCLISPSVYAYFSHTYIDIQYTHTHTHVHACSHTHTHLYTLKSWPKQNVTENPKVNLDKMQRMGAGLCKQCSGWWGVVDPINRTLWLHFRLFQFTKSARQTINVHAANVKTSLTPIKFNQGHSKCMLMLAWDQTSPIKCDLRQEGGLRRRECSWCGRDLV